VALMTLHNYIRRKSHDDAAFAEFVHNSNFVPGNFLIDVVAHSEIHGYQRPCWMDVVHDGIANNLMGQKKFHEVLFIT
jgi:hypothetical protein